MWIGTHSLEAVEVAGNAATFVFERSGDSRLVHGATVLRDRPVIEVLSRTLGAPAFSLSGRRFIFIEGDEQTAERERFYQLCGRPDTNRFVQSGSCEEVIRKLSAISQLARETDEQLRVGGIIDRDFRSQRSIGPLQNRVPIYVLECHEIENFFLQPDCLSLLLERAGGDPRGVQGILTRLSDQFAGMWILQRAARVNSEFKPSLPEPSEDMRRLAYGLPWSEIEPRIPDRAREFVALAGSLSPEDEACFIASIERSAASYRDVRDSDDLWKKCFGKQVLHAIPSEVGSSDAATLERQVALLWQKGEVAPSAELESLRAYVESV